MKKQYILVTLLPSKRRYKKLFAYIRSLGGIMQEEVHAGTRSNGYFVTMDFNIEAGHIFGQDDFDFLNMHSILLYGNTTIEKVYSDILLKSSKDPNYNLPIALIVQEIIDKGFMAV